MDRLIKTLALPVCWLQALRPPMRTQTTSFAGAWRPAFPNPWTPFWQRQGCSPDGERP
jgi:hypothetical protein